MQQTFEKIYAENAWMAGSGEGSLPENTERLRSFLQHFLREHAVRSVIDAGCGDWQFSQGIDWTGITYTGIDVAESVMRRNASLYRGPGRTFVQGDIMSISLPPADLFIAKDVFQHWPNDAICSFLPILKAFPRAIIVNDVGVRTNEDVPLGGYRGLDITRPPFLLDAQEALAYPWYSAHHRLWFIKKAFLLTSH